MKAETKVVQHAPLSFTQMEIDGQPVPDFGFRSFVAHLNDYDLFRAYAPAWQRDTQ